MFQWPFALLILVSVASSKLLHAVQPCHYIKRAHQLLILLAAMYLKKQIQNISDVRQVITIKYSYLNYLINPKDVVYHILLNDLLAYQKQLIYKHLNQIDYIDLCYLYSNESGCYNDAQDTKCTYCAYELEYSNYDFTHLHRCIRLASKYPGLIDYIATYTKYKNLLHNSKLHTQAALYFAIHDKGNTPIGVDLVSELLKFNSDVNFVIKHDKFCVTLLSHIIMQHNLYYDNRYCSNIVRRLLNANANLDIINCYNRSILDLAIDINTLDGQYNQSRFELLNTLISKGIQLNMQDSNGNTSLHKLLVLDKHHDDDKYGIIQTLVNNGCDISIKNNDGQCAIDVFIKEINKKGNISEMDEQIMRLLTSDETMITDIMNKYKEITA